MIFVQADFGDATARGIQLRHPSSTQYSGQGRPKLTEPDLVRGEPEEPPARETGLFYFGW